MCDLALTHGLTSIEEFGAVLTVCGQFHGYLRYGQLEQAMTDLLRPGVRVTAGSPRAVL
jgi:hypothetical protein